MPRPLKLYNRLNITQLSNVPPDLVAFDQWVVWKAEKRTESDTAKPLFDAKTGRKGSHSDPKTWSSYDISLKKFASDANFNGIGFVFSPFDPFTGIDLDEVRDPETGVVEPWAEALIAKMNSYTEVSPSGTGFKIFVIGAPPGPKNRRTDKAKIEMYSKDRYFTVTGNRYDKVSAKIEHRQGELVDLYHQVFGAYGNEEEPKARKKKEEERDPELTQMRDVSDADLVARACGDRLFRAMYVDGDTSAFANDESSADFALCCKLVYWTRGDAERIDRLFRASKFMRKKWDRRTGDQTYGARTIAKALEKQKEYFSPFSELFINYNGSDLTNARIFEKLAAGNFVHCRAWGKWLAWGGHSWQLDAEVEVFREIERVPAEVRRYAAEPTHDDDRRKFLNRAATGCESAGKLAAIESIASRHLNVTDTLFDARPYLLACPEGVIDLETGELRPGRREDYLTRGLDLSYKPSAQCPLWDHFLNEIMLGDQAMVDYLWRVIGYCLTGSTRERAFFILHGTGRNGKSLFTRVLAALLGRYSQAARFTTFLRKHNSAGPGDDIAHLMGARLVIASEADKTAQLDASLIKTLTGQDKVRARFLYSNEFEFEPQFKLMLVTNHIPKIDDESHALWDRLHLIPFRFRVEKEDRELYLKLLGELEGILAAAVAGAIAWQKQGLTQPKRVEDAGKDLRTSMDMLGQIFEEICVKDAQAECSLAAVYGAFTEWCRRENLRFTFSRMRVASWLRDRDIPVERSTKHNNQVWVEGVRLSDKFAAELKKKQEDYNHEIA